MDSYPVSGSYPRFGTHTVLLTFMNDDYIGTIKRTLGGNCMGAGILSSMVEDIEEENFAQEILEEFEGDIVLTNPAGDTFIIDDPETLSLCLVKAEIIDYQQKE